MDRAVAGFARCIVLAMLLAAASPSSSADADATLAARDRKLLDAVFADMPAQRPEQPDLYVIGFAGDGHEDVFRNEVLYLDALMSARFGSGKQRWASMWRTGPSTPLSMICFMRAASG